MKLSQVMKRGPNKVLATELYGKAWSYDSDDIATAKISLSLTDNEADNRYYIDMSPEQALNIANYILKALDGINKKKKELSQ